MQIRPHQLQISDEFASYTKRHPTQKSGNGGEPPHSGFHSKSGEHEIHAHLNNLIACLNCLP